MDEYEEITKFSAVLGLHVEITRKKKSLVFFEHVRRCFSSSFCRK